VSTKIVTTSRNWADGADTVTASSASGVGNATVSTTKRYSAVFTAPNTTNAALGVVCLMPNISAVKNLTLTVALQEYNGSTWVDKGTVAVNEANLPYDNQISTGNAMTTWLYLKLTTPYVFTTTTAGYYRWSFVSTAPGVTLRYSSVGTTEIHYLSVDNRNTAIADTDDLIVIGDSVTNTKATLSVAGDYLIGSAKNMTAVPSYILWDNALTVGSLGVVNFPITMNTSLKINGHRIILNGGEWHQGTSTNPVPVTYTSQLIWNGGTVAAPDHSYQYNYRPGENISYYGAEKEQIGWYSSGTGSTATPLITAEAHSDWVVGDELWIPGAVYNQWEIRYIKTKVNDTTFTLSASLGGSESAFANAHTVNDFIQNHTHNIKIISNDAAIPWSANDFFFYPTGSVYRNVEFKHVGGTTAARQGFYPTNSARYTLNISNCSSIPSASGYYSFYTYSNIQPTAKFTDIVIGIPAALATSKPVYASNYAGEHKRIYAIGGYEDSLSLGGNGISYEDIYVYNAQRRSAAGTYNYAGCTIAGNNNTWTNLYVQGCRDNAFSITGFKQRIKDGHFGDIYTNTHDINPGYIGTYQELVCDNCIFGSANLWSSDKDTSDTNSIYNNTTGSYITFANIGGNPLYNITYTPTGDKVTCGAGLTDTTTRTTGGYPFRLRPQTGTLLHPYTQDIPTGNIQNKDMEVICYVYIANAAYWAGTYQMPRLTVTYDNGTTTYAEAAKIAGLSGGAGTEQWQKLLVPIKPLTTYPKITATFTCMSDATTTNGYVYVTDWSTFYPKGVQLDIGKQSDYADGNPLTPPISTGISVNDVKEAVLSADPTDYADGTLGDKIEKIDIKTNLIAATV